MHDGWRGVADFLLRQPDGTYEVLDTKLARTAKPAYILQLLFYNEQLARIQGHEPEHIHVLLGNGEQKSFRPQEFAAYYRRVRSRLEAFVAEPRPTEPYPVDHCGICDFKPVCDAHWDAVDHLSRVAGVYRTQIDKLAAAGITTLAQLGRAPAGARPRRHQPRHLGEEPRAGRASALPPRARRRRLPPPAAAARGRPRAPARPLAGRPLLRLRGQPVLGRAGLARVPLGDPRRRRQLHAAARARPRDGADRVRDLRRPRPRAARAPSRDARLPLRRVRDHRAQAPHGAVRDARARARRPAPPRRLRRPAPRRPQRAPRLAAGLRAEGDGGVSRLRAPGGGEGRRHLDRHLRAVDADRRAGAPRPDRRVQPRGLHRDAAPPRLAARAAGGGARALRPVPAAGARRVEADHRGEGRTRGAPHATARRGRGARRAAPRLPRPGAQAGLVGVLRPARDDAHGARRGRGVDRPARADGRALAREAVGRPRVHLPGAGAQAEVGEGACRSRDEEGRRRDPRARPRGAPPRAEAGSEPEGRAVAGGADPRRSVPDAGAGGGADAARALAARGRPAVRRRSSPSSGASRSTDRSRPPTSSR